MTKSELRPTFLQRQRSLSPADAERLSQAIRHLFFETFALPLRRFQTIHCFLPIVKNREINTWLIIRQLQRDFPLLDIAVPKTDPLTNTVTSHLLDGETVLTDNRWGVPEPQNGPSITPYDVDLVLVPLLAYDQAGHRVGYGKGFYDRFLAQCRPDAPKIGLSYFEPVSEITDANGFDVALDACVTPGKVWKFGSPRLQR